MPGEMNVLWFKARKQKYHHSGKPAKVKPFRMERFAPGIAADTGQVTKALCSISG